MKIFSCTIGFILAFQMMSIAQESKLENDSYFPMKVGNQWTYKWMGTNEQSLIISDYSKKYNAYTFERISKLGELPPVTVDELYEIRGDKLLLLAKKGGLLGIKDWEFKIPAPIILKLPLIIGLKWISDEGNQKTIYEVLERVTVNEFNNVLEVKSTTIFTQSGEKAGEKFLYYAKGIGLIKEEIIGTVTPILKLIEYDIQ